MGIGSVILAICVIAGVIALTGGPFLIKDYFRLSKDLKDIMHDDGMLDDTIDKAFKNGSFSRIRRVRVYQYNHNENLIVVKAGNRWDFIDRGKSEFHSNTPELTDEGLMSLVKLMIQKARHQSSKTNED